MKELQATWDQVMNAETSALVPASDEVHQDVTDIPPAQQ